MAQIVAVLDDSDVISLLFPLMILTSGQGIKTVIYAVQFLDHINYIKDLAIRTVSCFVAIRSW